MTESASLPTHNLFKATGHDSDADSMIVTIRSADNVLFNIHHKNLEVNTGAFPGKEFDARGEVVHLTERADVLAILFEFIYPRRHPTLEDENFETVAAVAEAIEKYEVFSGMYTSIVRLRQFLPQHAAEILAHAIRHDYPKLINEAVPCISRSPLVTVLEKLPLDSVLPWARYYQAWGAVFNDGRKLLDELPHVAYNGCSANFIGSECYLCLMAWVSHLEHIDTLPGLENALAIPVLSKKENAEQSLRRCSHCIGARLPLLVERIRRFIEAIPLFMEYLRTLDDHST